MGGGGDVLACRQAARGGLQGRHRGGQRAGEALSPGAAKPEHEMQARGDPCQARAAPLSHPDPSCTQMAGTPHPAPSRCMGSPPACQQAAAWVHCWPRPLPLESCRLCRRLQASRWSRCSCCLVKGRPTKTGEGRAACGAGASGSSAHRTTRASPSGPRLRRLPGSATPWWPTCRRARPLQFLPASERPVPSLDSAALSVFALALHTRISREGGDQAAVMA